jgi:RNA polymerase sigma factor (sigma-70 family)
MATSQTSEVIRHLRRAVLLRDGAGLTDGQLLEDYLSRRDEAAFAALVRRHGPMVWGVCRRTLRNYHDAEDAFQASFLVLVRKAASVVPREMVANWLYGVARRTALKARTTAARRKGRERQVTEMPEPAVAEPDLWRDLRPLLDEALSRLPDRYRVVIILCDLEGNTRKEVAEQLGLPEGTVGSRLARARAILAKRLARHGLAVSGGALAAVLSQNVAPADVPTPVVSSTSKAASVFAAGQAAGVISVRVAALTDGVLRAMFVNKIKVGLGVLLVLAVCLCGIGTAVGLGQQEASPKKADPEAKKAEAKATAEKEMLERLQGKWKCISYHYNGVKSEPDMTCIYKGNTWETTLDGKVTQSGTFKFVDLNASPKQMDLLITFSVAEEEKGRTCSAIFMLDGDAMCYCASDAAKDPRPTGFATQEGDGCSAGLYKRVDAKEKK